MLEVQKYLQAGNSLQSLEDTYAISHRVHPKYSNLILLKYSQIDSNFNHQIVQECRGIILDANNNWAIVSRAFGKFFNESEGLAASIDWTTAKVLEKKDGSLCTVYFYDNQWHVSTTGSPAASGDVHGFNFTFHELFWKVMRSYTDIFDRKVVDSNLCYYFELVTPYNRVVTLTDKEELFLLGARNMISQQEQDPQATLQYLQPLSSTPLFQTAPQFNLSSIEEIAKTFYAISPLAQEGYVVCDANFNRVKVKHPGYVALHHAKDGMSPKAMLEIARTGETSEVISAFPEFKEMIDSFNLKLDRLSSALEKHYHHIQHLVVQKDFALEANKTLCPSALFQLRAKKVSSIKEYFAKVHIDSLMSLLEKI